MRQCDLYYASGNEEGRQKPSISYITGLALTRGKSRGHGEAEVKKRNGSDEGVGVFTQNQWHHWTLRDRKKGDFQTP